MTYLFFDRFCQFSFIYIGFALLFIGFHLFFISLLRFSTVFQWFGNALVMVWEGFAMPAARVAEHGGVPGLCTPTKETVLMQPKADLNLSLIKFYLEFKGHCSEGGQSRL